ncbi:MAG: DNA polymerase III subunit alpha [Halanaerobiales bacterium]|nr:DNA polymerase III subunit alpha [Halanaerobiales bacterium]
MAPGKNNKPVKGFVHLHNHTEYSLLDGALRIKDLVRKTQELAMPAAAITDHGVLYGLVNFYQQALKAGIKPILGCEVYLSPVSRHDKKNRERYHLILLAADNQGYHNLIKIVSSSWLEGFYYKPRVDKELLYQFRQGLIALSACLKGEIPQLLLRGEHKAAEKVIGDYQAIFGRDNFFLELQDHFLPEQKQVNSQLIKLGASLNIPLVITNDVHYLEQSSADCHDILLALQTGKRVADQDRLTFPNDQFYFKTEEEITALFPRLTEARLNTLSIAERCEVKLDFHTFYLPEFPEDKAPKPLAGLLREKCEEGLKKRGLTGQQQVRDRLDYELKIIEEKGYVSSFLIVWDFIDFAERKGIRVGPGRGSAAGSLVSYLIGITKINPLDYNLIFERFLNPERVKLPDIDIDFDEQRDDIIEYVKERHGRNRVAQIGTFGTMAARAAIRDVGRVIDLPIKKVDRIAKMVPGRPGITLDEAIESNTNLKQLYQEDQETRKLLDYARGIEGLPRHISTHAAGVIIGPDDLSEIIPLQSQDQTIITQYPMDDLEKLGLLKMDFLGLRNLTVIGNTLELIKEKHGVELAIDNLDLALPEVYQLLQEGKTLGVFQMESYLFRDLNQRLRPDCFSDLIAILSLGRPGPLGSGLVDHYIESRHGLRQPDYLHPTLEPILAETFGLILYQEQVIEIASKLAGYSMGEADLLREGMGKKKKELIANERERFIRGAQANGIEKEIAEHIFNQMEYFAGYGFNKSHSTAYAMLAYQTAYLKVKYPAEFMAALLSSVMNNLDKVGQYIRECQEMGLAVLPPDINQSGYKFKTGRQGEILFGLKAIKNVGTSAIRAIIEERTTEPFGSFEDFIKRVNLSKINIPVIEALIKAGAFAVFPQNRSQLLVKFEEIYEKANSGRRQRTAGQTSFFDLVEEREEFFQDVIEYPALEELDLAVRLEQEKEYLGIYLSAHPLDCYREKINHFTTGDRHTLSERTEGEVTIAGTVIESKEHLTKRNSLMTFLTIEDWSGKIEVVVFPDLYHGVKTIIKPTNRLLIKGRIDEDKVLAERIISLDWPFLEIKPENSQQFALLEQLFKQHQGGVPVFFQINSVDSAAIILIDQTYWITSSNQFEKKLKEIVGAKGYNIY